jgi:hypothetical protein
VVEVDHARAAAFAAAATSPAHLANAPRIGNDVARLGIARKKFTKSSRSFSSQIFLAWRWNKGVSATVIHCAGTEALYANGTRKPRCIGASTRIHQLQSTETRRNQPSLDSIGPTR